MTMRILIIDDSETSQLLLTTILGSAGYEDLLSADSYENAQSVLETCAREGRCVDLILMDINMPGTDGIRATELLKEMEEFKSIPIIIVTGVEDERRLEAAFTAGATDYIQKPVSRIELQARVRAALRLRKEMKTRLDRERELEKLTQELLELSNRDGLTEVGNRRLFNDRFGNEWLRAQRECTPISLLLIDIDFFKKYNDSLGHLEGDTCLKRVAKALKTATRRPADFLARYGGEEFVIVLPNTDTEGAKNVADLAMEAIAKEAIPHPDSVIADRLTISVGIGTALPEIGQNNELLIEASDIALYQAKQAGRNRVEMKII